MPSFTEIMQAIGGSTEAGIELAFLAVMFLSAALFIFGVFAMRRPNNVARRLHGAQSGAGAAGGASVRYGGNGNSVERLLAPFLSALSGNQERQSIARRRLVQAGYYNPNAVQVYYAIRIALAVTLTPVVLLVTSLLFKSLNGYELAAVALGSVAVGFYLPLLAVTNSIQKRQQKISEGLPDALDLLLVCVEAGLGLDAALNRVAGELVVTNPVLSEQLRLVALEFQAGKGRSDALRGLAARTGVDDVKSFVTLLVHSDRLGTSIAQSLRVHAADMRAKRMLRAEEKANKIPVKVILPIGVFFLPCLITLIFTPLIIRVVRTLAPALGVSG
jgi:tight adherence protein C